MYYFVASLNNSIGPSEVARDCFKAGWIVAGLPDEVGKLVNLEKLNLSHCNSLTSEWSLIDIPPVLYQELIFACRHRWNQWLCQLAETGPRWLQQPDK